MRKQKENIKRCPLCGTKLWIPSYKCEQCNRYYKEVEVIKEREGKTRCPNCALMIKPVTKGDLKKVVKCQECGFSFEDITYWEENLNIYSELTPKEEIEVLGSELQSLTDEIEKILSDVQNEGEVYKCPKCGKETEVDAKSCSECGVEFFNLDEVPETILKHETEVGVKKFECAECGTRVPFEAAECPSCGILFIGEDENLFECPACSFKVDYQTKQCPKCGIEFILAEEAKEKLTRISLEGEAKKDLQDVFLEEGSKEELEEIFLREETKEEMQEIYKKEEQEPEAELKEMIGIKQEMVKENDFQKIDHEKKKINATPTTGLTNGLTNGLRTEKHGLTNGFTNGYRRADLGLTNGITNGLVNGLRALRMGMTNGLTNGNGITNGLGIRPGKREKKKGKWKFVAIPFLIFLLVISPYLFVGFEKEPKKIEIDGRFEDWMGLSVHSDEIESQAFNPNVDIIDYRVDTRLMDMSFYLKVTGDLLKGESGVGNHVDTVYIFIDTDGSSDSGYYIKGIGADFMVEIYGTNSELMGHSLYSFTASEQNWNLWTPHGMISAAISGSELEAQVPFELMNINEDDMVEVLFYMQSWNKFEDFSDSIISNEMGVLQITQQGVGDEVISGDKNRLLKLEMEAFSSDIIINEIKAKRTGSGSEDDLGVISLEDENQNSIAFGTINGNEVTFLLNLRLSMNQRMTLFMVVSIGDNAIAGNSVGFKIQSKNDVRINKKVVDLKRISPEEDKCDCSYIISVPENIKIDGAFGDWNGNMIQNDTSGDVKRTEIDILEYGVSRTQTKAAFYLRVDEQICAGIEVPYWNNKEKSEPLPGGEPSQLGIPSLLEPKTGEDVVYIFIDTIPNIGYKMNLPIFADHMIEVRGRYNRVVSSSCYVWSGQYFLDWDWIGCAPVNVALDTVRMELEVDWDALGIFSENGTYSVYFLATDWEKRETDYINEDEVITGTRGTRSENLVEIVSGHSAGANFGFGWNVSYAGDLNSDGYDDIVVGAPYLNTTTGGGDWWNNSWSNRMRLIFDNSGQAENLLNFPIMVNLSSSNFDYSDAKSDGSDIRFIDADGATELKYHFENWNTAGNSYIWVNVTQIDGISRDDYIWMYYNNSGASNVQDEENTWDKAYVGIWHLDETGTGTRFDSTSYNNDGTTNGYEGDEATTGKCDGADDFDGTNDYVSMDSVTIYLDTVFTFAFWMKADTTSNAALGGFHSSGGDNRWHIEMIANHAGIEGNQGSITISDGKWHYIVGVTDGTKSILYVDGELDLDNIDATTNLLNSDLASIAQEYDPGPIPSDFFNGKLDEVRISNVARSRHWIKAQCLSQNDEFITYGSKETKGKERGAVYIFFGNPGIALDDINAANADVTIKGTNTGDLFGWSVSDAGNINADSYDDIIIGAPGYGADRGRAYIILGRTTGSWGTIDDADTDSDVILTGMHDYDRFGWSVSGAGDVNGDNYDDVIIGAYSLGVDQGRAYILYGPNLNRNGYAYAYAENIAEVELPSTATYIDYLTLTVNPPVATKYLILVASDVAPDDKFGDNTYVRLIIDNANVYHETNREFEDAVDWYHFSAMKYLILSAGSHDIQLEYKTDGSTGRFRNTRIIAMEIDIPAEQYDENEGITQSTGSEITAAQTTFTPGSSGNYLIIATANLRCDSIVNSVYGRMYIDGTLYGETLMEPDDATNERFNFGVFKNITLDTGSHTIRLTVDSETASINTYMEHAHIVAIRLDEYSEFYYNEAEAQNGGPGGWETLVTNSYTPVKNGDFIILGTAQWCSNDDSTIDGIRLQTAGVTRQDFRLENQDSTDRHMTFGMDKRTLSGAQTDTVDQFMNTGGWSRFARLISLPLGLDYVRLTGASPNEKFGFSVSNAGDTNNTGYDDVIVGAPGGDRAYIFCGRNVKGYDIKAANANIILSGTGGTNFGFSVGNAGDINADGTYDDVIVGAPGTTNGNAYIYYGGNPMNMVVDLTLTGKTAGDKFGYSVHYAGDIDSDGEPDVIVGAPYFTNASKTQCGAFYVFCGGSDVDNTDDYSNEGEYAYDHFGWSVSFAGDINGDGLNETLCGAPHYDTQSGESPASTKDAGKAYCHSKFIIPEFSDTFLPVFGIIALFMISRGRSRKRRVGVGI